MLKRISLTLALMTPLIANAGFFEDAINQVKKTAKEAYDKSVDKPNDSQEKNPPPAEPDKTQSSTTPPPSAAAKPSTTQATSSSPGKVKGDKYIELKDIPAGRRPATPASLGLVRLRYDPDWLDEKTRLNITEGVIYCQQNMIKPIGHIRGCIGKREMPAAKGDRGIRVVPVFDPAEIDGKNRKFVAQANKDRVKPVLIELANHLSTEFGNTLSWRGEYDFDQQVLKVDIRNLEHAGSYEMHRIPKEVTHLDVYKAPDRNFGGIQGERYPMRAYIPEGLSGGIIALAFDRKLSEGRLPMPPAKAEALFQGQSGNTISGMAVVEFSVTDTRGKAALATLEQVKILPYNKGNIDPETAEPVMTLPASTFPKIAAVKQVAEKSVAKKPEPKPEPVKPKAPTKPAPVDPYARANTGKPFGPDVTDLRLGMTMQEADRLIRERKPVMKVIDGKQPRPFSAARMYILEPGDEFIGLMTMKTAKGERIASINRTLYFDPDNPPTQTAITASVDKKYGTPTYKEEINGRFERLWYHAKPDDLDVYRACRYAMSDSASNVWLDNGKYYQWTMPWRETKYMGVNASRAVGHHRDLTVENASQCGTTVRGRYEENSGMLTGPMLNIHVYDPAWIYADFKKLQDADAKQGAKGLDL